MEEKSSEFSFEISLSVLNHLGRNLYRSFTTVLGEAISNSWDANAKNVQIFINKEENKMIIKDDGDGMTKNDFQNKFLKIGYSKRKDGRTSSDKGRPYIGRKGIGKLALLSCADRISVISKTSDTEYIGGTIDNSGLDEAIKDDLTPNQYKLGLLKEAVFKGFVEDHKQGTIIYFENIKDGIKSSFDSLSKTIALYFRFSLIDNSFNIWLDGEKITLKHLDSLVEKTEFLWNINKLNDPFADKLLKQVKEHTTYEVKSSANGFIASVEKPRYLKAIDNEEKVGIDLFVNGRLREKNILKHMPEFSTRHVASYLYGQIHYNKMDVDESDRFTTSRESIKAGDPKFDELLAILKEQILERISNEWDKWRREHKHDGDPENKTITPKERKAEELFNAISGEYESPQKTKEQEMVNKWVESLRNDATYNFLSYADCFVSENLIRKFIKEKNIATSEEAKRDIDEWKKKEAQNKSNGNVSIELRQDDNDLSYLDMAGLSALVDKKDNDCLYVDGKQYRPIRDALMHTALLTDEAKRKLRTIFENIKARVSRLLLGGN